MKTYLDSSAVVKLYIPEPESPVLVDWIRRRNAPLPFTPLHDLEIRNAIELRVFRGEFPAGIAKRIRDRIDSDIDRAVYIRTAIPWEETFEMARDLAVRHTSRCGSRSLDVLHVAAASRLDFSHFLTYDARQEKLARLGGLKIPRLPTRTR